MKKIVEPTVQDVFGTMSFGLYHIDILRCYKKHKFNK